MKKSEMSRRSAIIRAINRFEKAVDDYAFLGTIPVDTEAALQARAEIENEYARARELLVALFMRYSA